MRFRLVSDRGGVPDEGQNIGYLRADNWNDWWEFKTLYTLTYFDDKGVAHPIGGVKIGQFNWNKSQERPQLEEEFITLSAEFFSLGQDAHYYESILRLGEEISDALLSALNDIVRDDELFARASGERIMGRSLMRSVARRTVSQQFRRILSGGVRLTSYSFQYRSPVQLDPNFEPIELDFTVEPDSKPPTNIQVIVGRNGVGKSFFLNAMSRALVYPNMEPKKDGAFSDSEDLLSEDYESPFASVLSVTFSAFDDFAMMGEKRDALRGVLYTNIGLRKRVKDASGDWMTITQQPRELAKEFIDSAKSCSVGERRTRWRAALRALQSDPMFGEAE